MKRFILIAVLAAFGCSGKSGDRSNDGTESSADADQIKALAPEASGLDAQALKELAASGAIPSIDNLPDQRLTIVLVSLGPTRDRTDAEKKEFEVLTNHPVKLFKLMEESADKGYGTLLQLATIKEVTCRVEGNSASGVIRFEAEDVCRGTIEYSAKKTDKAWRIDEFRLPSYKITVTRGADGRWRKK